MVSSVFTIAAVAFAIGFKDKISHDKLTFCLQIIIDL